MKIRTRLIVVLSVLAGLIAVVSLTAVTAFARLGGFVAAAINENLRSIDACTAMGDALAQQDRGFLLLLAGQVETGRQEIRKGTAAFNSALVSAMENVTMPGEEQKVETLANAFDQLVEATRPFRLDDESAARSPAPALPTLPVLPVLPVPLPVAAPAAVPSVPPSATLADYAVLAEPHLIEVRAAIQDLSAINHAGIEDHSTNASRSGWRRSAWVISVGVLGLALAVFFGRRLYKSITVPLEAVSRGIAAIGKGDLFRRVGHHGRDELGQIATAVNALAERLAASEGTREGRLRMHERLAAAVLDAFDPLGFLVDRESQVVLAGRQVRQRLGEDPLATLRAGGGGLIPPGEIDRRLEEVLLSRPSQLPSAPAGSPDRISVRPVLGRGGSILGVLVQLDAGAVR